MRCFFAMLLLFVAAPCVFAQARRAEVVDEVRVRRVGPGVVDEGYVIAHIGTKAGQKLDQAGVTADIKGLLATGRFTDVTADVDRTGGKIALVFSVQGRLKLGVPVVVRGAKHFSANKIRDLLAVEVGDLVDESMLAVRGQKVIKEYLDDNYADASLKWSVNVVDAKHGVAAVDLQVTEGAKVAVKSVSVTGNKRVPSSFLETAAGKAAWWDPFEWFDSGKFDKAEFEAKRSAIKAACASRGFLDAEVSEAETIRRRSGSYGIVFQVKEGLLYRVGKVSIKGVTLFPEIELARLIPFKKGAVAAPAAIRAAGDAVRKYYADRGYIGTRVNTAFDTRRADRLGEGVLDVTFTVVEGPLVHVRNVFIRGNAVTQEKVIRRELAIRPGDVLAERNVLYSENRLRNLGFFKQVTDHPEPAARPDEADLVFTVEEQSTGSFSVGGGFSSVDNFVGYFEISEGNFDIFSWPPKGAGQKLRLHGQFGSKTTQGDITFIEPWFMDRRITMKLDLFTTAYDYDEYDRQSVGGAITFGWPLHFFFDQCEMRYSIEKLDVSDVRDTNEYTRISGDRAGEPFYFSSTNQLKSSLGLLLSRDTRDATFCPSSGHRFSARAYLVGGILGGDEEMYGWETRMEKHFTLWGDHVLSLRAKAEVVDEYGDAGEMPISERLFAGGAGWSRGIRGFDYRDVGPKVVRTVPDTTIEKYRPIGGRSLAIGSVEYAIPLVEKLKLVLFADTGNVAEDAYDFNFKSMATSAGVELRLDFRQFPIRINYGWVLDKDNEHTDEHPWGFSLGSGF